MKPDKLLESVLIYSHTYALQKHYEFIVPELVLLMAMDCPEVEVLFEITGADIEGTRQDLIKYIDENVSILDEGDGDSDSAGGTGEESDFGSAREPARDSDLSTRVYNSVGFAKVLENAAEMALSSGREEINMGHFLVSLFNFEDLFASYILKKNGMEEGALLDAVSDMFTARPLDYEGEGGDEDRAGENSSEEVLSRYAVNLTQLAREGKLDSLVGRKEELERTIEVLCRKTKNNPLHVGDSGVGKTAITEGLAQMIVADQVPEILRGAEIYSVEMSSLVAGTKFRGEFEKRIKAIVKAVQEKEKAILFIDEIHTLTGTGAGSSGSLDAANILKPALAKGNLRCIGSTTFEEYASSFEKDRALSRRFQKIEIIEPTSDECVKILKGVIPSYQKFHGVKYSADCAQEAVKLSVQFITDRRLPDKAIDVIDEAGVYSKLHKKGRNITVTVQDIKRAVSKIARVPLEDVTVKEKETLRELEHSLGTKIFGQDNAVRQVSLAVKKARAGFRNLEKPEASFLFVGPTGVGKTELVKVLADSLGEKLVRFDMSEYQESYSVSRLIGSAPGYVGFENGGVLTEAVRKNPHAVILFDEIEKAHEDIYNTLLQVLDYGTLTDSQGRKADFRNCLIIFTSNAGARDMEKLSVGFDRGDSRGEAAMSSLKEAVEKTFSPEFRNRLDSVVYFGHLEREIVLSIARKALDEIGARLAGKKVRLVYDEDVARFVADGGYSREFGARNIMRFAEEKCASPLIDEILFGKLSLGGSVTMKMEEGQLKMMLSAEER